MLTNSYHFTDAGKTIVTDYTCKITNIYSFSETETKIPLTYYG